MKILVLDIENSNTLKSFLIGIGYWEGRGKNAVFKYKSFVYKAGDDITEFLEFINEKYLVIFNASYDINHLKDLCPEMVMEEKHCIVSSKSRPIQFSLKCSYKGRSYLFYVYDLFMLFPSSLSVVAQLFSLNKKENEGLVDIDDIEFMNKIREIRDYNYHDVYITGFIFKNSTKFFSKLCSEILTHIFDKYVFFVLNKTLTISSISHKLLLAYCAVFDVLYNGGSSSYKQMDIPLNRRIEVYFKEQDIRVRYKGKLYYYTKVKEMYNEYFKGYKGGMVINEFVQKKNVYFYDVNSLYPSVIQHFKVSPFEESKEISLKEIINNDDVYGVAHVVLMSCNLPLGFPLFIPEENKNYNTVWKDLPNDLYIPFSELRYLYCRNPDVITFISARGKVGKYPLKDLITWLYKLRLKYKSEKNPFEKAIKLIMNSIYGKFGSRGMSQVFKRNFKSLEEALLFIKSLKLPEDKEKGLINFSKIEHEIDDEIYFFSLHRRFDYFVFYAFRQNKFIEDFYLASDITSKARIVMQKLAESIKSKGGEIYAVDTDSFKTNLPPDAIKEHISQTELGKLKYEFMADEFISVRKKFYAYKKGNDINFVVKGLKNFSVLKNEINRELLWNYLKQAMQTYSSFSVKQERKASLDNNTLTELFDKQFKVVADGGILDYNLFLERLKFEEESDNMFLNKDEQNGGV